MATNPNAIFGEALATGPRQIPLSELQNQIAATRQAQAQTANIGSQMAQRQQETIGLQQQNTLRQRQIEDEQAVRDSIARHTTNIPVTAPNANIPTPGTDSDGNPLPLDLGYHQIAAKGAVQAPHTDYDAVYADLNSQGRFAAANTLRQSIQDRRAKDLENSKAQTALFETQNNRRNELAASVANAPPEQKAAVASQVGQQLEQEGLIPPGSGATFGPNEADVLYRSSAGAKDPIRAANASLGVSEAQAKELAASATEKEEQTRQIKLSNDAAEQFIRNPAAVLGPGGIIHQLGLSPTAERQLNSQLTALYQMPGTPLEKANGVKGAIQAAVNADREEAKEIRLRTNPQIISAEAQKGALTELAKARLTGGPVANINDPVEQRRVLDLQSKAEDAWHKAEGQANQLQNFVDLARSPEGNQLAAGMLPVAVVRELVNRVNNNELKLAGGGVSVARRLENWLSKGATGKPSDDTLRDMETFGQAVLAAQGNIYRGTIAGLNRNRKSTFDTEPPVTPQVAPTAPAARPAAQPAAGPQRVTTRAAYDALPAGTPYIDSKGNPGVKGQK